MKSHLEEASKNMQITIDNLLACLDGTEGLETMTISNMIYKANRLKGNIDQAYLSAKEDK
jgi:hypothetical protein